MPWRLGINFAFALIELNGEGSVMTTFDNAHMSVSGTTSRIKPPRISIVLIDDSQVFCSLMLAVSTEFDIDLKAYHSLADMYSFAKLKEFDLAMIDYYLESWSGVEIARYVEVFFSDLPVVLISADTLEMRPNWPACIKGVLAKSIGPQQLFKQSLDIFYRQRFYRLLEEMAFGIPRKSQLADEFKPTAIG